VPSLIVVHAATLLLVMETQLKAWVVQLGIVSRSRKVAAALVEVPCTPTFT
jgi:hypothetical protein